MSDVLQELKDQVNAMQVSIDAMQAREEAAIKALEAEIAANGDLETKLRPIIDQLKAEQADVDSTGVAASAGDGSGAGTGDGSGAGTGDGSGAGTGDGSGAGTGDGDIAP